MRPKKAHPTIFFFLKLFQKWGNKVARISNHNYYHEKSALREAIRKNGIRKFIAKHELHTELQSYDGSIRYAARKWTKI